MTTTIEISDIEAAFRAIGLTEGDTVYVISALWRMPADAGSRAGGDTSAIYYQALRSVIGDAGTIVVPTSSQNLCNTEIPFDLANTPSFERGLFTEFVRKLPGALRSFHPFTSYAAIGPKAALITSDVTRQAYGPETPEARMIDLGAKFLALGVGANIITSVHHVEHVMGVPYRYHKEFMHPVVRGSETVVEPFYQFVWYRNSDVQRSQNRRLFDCIKGKLEIREAKLGRGKMSTLSLADFFQLSVQEFKRDIYIWCNQPPTIRPYQQ